MIGDYSIMDLATFLTALIALFGVLNSIIRNSRDTSAILREFTAQSKEHDGLSKEHTGLTNAISGVSRKVSDECEQLSKEHYSIKNDTRYIRNEMLREEKARENLYNNTSRAKEILETMDMMKEVVIQNSKLNAEVAELKVKNQKLLVQKDDKSSKLLDAIGRFKTQLAEFEMYGESEDIRFILRKIENELSEYVDWMYRLILYIFCFKKPTK